ncbi:MAG: hypothetical protein J2P36_26535, partial [Ktedonobacteraceae bacterium]|nr:hypothetical protein [Ktedonobacteraceae bacterium]
MVNVLAFDLGASSGRAVAGTFDGKSIAIRETHRFPNDLVRVGSHLYWDILRLFTEVKQGLVAARTQGYSDLRSI